MVTNKDLIKLASSNFDMFRTKPSFNLQKGKEKDFSDMQKFIIAFIDSNKNPPEEFAENLLAGAFTKVKSTEWNVFADIYRKYIFGLILPFLNESQLIFPKDVFEKIGINIGLNLNQMQEKIEKNTIFDYYKELHYNLFGNRDYF